MNLHELRILLLNNKKCSQGLSIMGQENVETSEGQSNMRKVAYTALAGTSIEWYDFFLYGAAAALIFPTTFFGEMAPATALILSLLTFAAGFIARPIGGIIFGHFGDRVGRKKTLVMALLLMGISSTLIGLLPTYAMIGVAAPILLTLLRFAQGLAIGGQWGGAMLLVTESAPSNKRGYYGAFAQAGAPIGVILANLALILTSALVSEEFFYTWGWRIPFLASAVLIGISMYIQLNLEDTKVSPDTISGKSMLKFKDANGNVYYSNFKTPTIEAGKLKQLDVAATPGRIIKPYQADASYDVTESMIVDDLFRPDSGIGRENITVDDPNTELIETTTYKVNYDKMDEAMKDLSKLILTLQGNGDYDGVSKLVNEKGIISKELQVDLDKLSKIGIPVDVTFEQGVEVLGLK